MGYLFYCCNLILQCAKFYKCMAEHEIIEEEDYVEICEEIKESLPFRVEDCEEFNDW